MGQQNEYTIRIRQDGENGVWYVDSSDIPGLNVESSSLDSLVEVVRDLAPELIEHNLQRGSPPSAAG